MLVRSLTEYAKEHLLKHLLDSGMSLDDICSLIMRMPYDDPLRSHYADQYVMMLPEEDQFKVSISLLPNPTKKVKIMILTVEGQPSLNVPESISVRRVDELVESIYGLRGRKLRHSWVRTTP